jgi:Mg-chelatase subunit ChlD
MNDGLWQWNLDANAYTKLDRLSGCTIDTNFDVSRDGRYVGVTACGGKFRLIERSPVPRAPILANCPSTTALALKRLCGGGFHQVDDAAAVANRLRSLVIEETRRFADVFFLIDKTGSMSDDILEVQRVIQEVMDEMPFHSWAGLGLFGDRIHDGADWLRISPLTRDMATVRKEVSQISTAGGGPDAAESLYDAAYQVIASIHWESYSDRKLIILTDAPPHTGSLTNHSLADVVQAAKSRNVAIHIITTAK